MLMVSMVSMAFTDIIMFPDGYDKSLIIQMIQIGICAVDSHC